MKQLVCPISEEKINEQITRLNALFALAIVVAGFVFHSPLLLAFLMADFFIRAFTKVKYSPISFASRTLTNALNLRTKNIDKAPKIFAARLGFIMTLVIVALYFLQLNTAAIVVGGILVFFASL